jgi:hypothetical protein
VKLKQLFWIICILSLSSASQAQESRATAQSRITVRIPHYATLTLSNNSTRQLVDKSAIDINKSVSLNTNIASKEVISNKPWSINVTKETTLASNSHLNSANPQGTPSTVTIIYVTSLD